MLLTTDRATCCGLGHLFSALRAPCCSADFQSVVFGTQNACGVLPLSPHEERAGREPERGEIDKKRLLSPALSSFFEEERERKCGCALKANLLPNTTDFQSAVSRRIADLQSAECRIGTTHRSFPTPRRVQLCATIGRAPVGVSRCSHVARLCIRI